MYLYPLGFLPTLSHTSREVLHTKLYRVVGPQKHEEQGKERNGLAPSSEECHGQCSQIAPPAEPGEAGEIEDHRVVRKRCCAVGNVGSTW